MGKKLPSKTGLQLPSHAHEPRIELLREALRQGSQTRAGRMLRDLAQRAALAHARRLIADSRRARATKSAQLRREAKIVRLQAAIEGREPWS